MFNKNVFWKFSAPLLCALAVLPPAAHSQNGPTETLPGHVLEILPNATPLPQDPNAGRQPLSLGVALNLSDQAGFDAFAQAYNDPNSATFHKPLSAADFTARFGPTQQAYDSVLAYLQQNGFTLATGSTNRRTLTVSGTRAQAEAAFHVTIGDYQLGSRAFYAIATDPSVPTALAPLIGAVAGLSNLAQPRAALFPSPLTPGSTATAYNAGLTPAGSTNSGGLPPGLDGSGQTIGLLEYDNYLNSDVSDWLASAGLDKDLINRLERFPVNGGTAPSGCSGSGCGETEALLDIAAALGVAPGAKVIVFVAAPGTDPLTLINAALSELSASGGVLSASLGWCEPEVPASYATSTDSLLQGYIYTENPITLFAATGDSGGTCAGGSGATYPNTTVFPADAPHAIAVGGTTLQVGSDNSYSSESWWLSSGGFGVSTIFKPRPSYQNPFTSVSGRSVPDVSIEASPGIIVCQATGSVSPNCFPVQGTSLATPLWAGFWALAMQASNDAEPYSLGSPGLGFLYSMPSVFHSPAGMTGTGNNFAHVGLGSPDLTALIGQNLKYYTEVDSVSPSTGPAGGGTTVTITGKGFVGVKKVTFGGVDATHVTIYSDTKLTADSPAASGNQVDVQVVTPAATTAKSSKDIFSYLPEITKVSPDSGPLIGGTAVTVSGHGLASISLAFFKFDFGGTPATSVSCVTSTSCTMVAPAHAAETVDVIARAPWGDSPSTSADQFTYQSPGISSFSPKSGPITGGITVTASGKGLSDKDKFEFGGSFATAVVCASTSSCTMVVPKHSAATVNVGIDTTSGDSIAAAQFTYDAPTITGVSPLVGPTVGGQGVAITGLGFDSSMTVKFGGAPVTVFCPSAVACSVTSPKGTGSVHITATLAGVTSEETSADLYTYAVFPSVASLSVYNGPVAGGIPVVITGTNFSTVPGGTTILFGTLPATGVSCGSSTQCMVTAPVRDSSAGFLEVSVTAKVNGYTSIGYVPFQFGTPPPPPPPPPCKGTACM